MKALFWLVQLAIKEWIQTVVEPRVEFLFYSEFPNCFLFSSRQSKGTLH